MTAADEKALRTYLATLAMAGFRGNKADLALCTDDVIRFVGKLAAGSVDGWQLAPIEADQNMIAAGEAALTHSRDRLAVEGLQNLWRDMLTAAPTLTKGGAAMKPLPKLEPNRERAFIRCNKCKAVYWYDFQPFSLSCPVITKPCGHGTTRPLYATSTSITEKQFEAARKRAALTPQQREPT